MWSAQNSLERKFICSWSVVLVIFILPVECLAYLYAICLNHTLNIFLNRKRRRFNENVDEDDDGEFERAKKRREAEDEENEERSPPQRRGLRPKIHEPNWLIVVIFIQISAHITHIINFYYSSLHDTFIQIVSFFFKVTS